MIQESKELPKCERCRHRRKDCELCWENDHYKAKDKDEVLDVVED